MAKSRISLPGPREIAFVVGKHMLNPLGTFAGSYMIHVWAEALRAHPRWRWLALFVSSIQADFPRSAFLGYPIYGVSELNGTTARVEFQVPMQPNPLTVGKVVFSKEPTAEVVIPKFSDVQRDWVPLTSAVGEFAGLPIVFKVPESFSTYLEHLVGYSLDLLESASEHDRGLLLSEGVDLDIIDRLLPNRRYAGVSFRINLFRRFYGIRTRREALEIYRKPWPTTVTDDRMRQGSSIEGLYAFVAGGKEIVATVAFRVVRIDAREVRFVPIDLNGQVKKK